MKHDKNVPTIIKPLLLNNNTKYGVDSSTIVIPRSHHPFDPEKVEFIGVDGEPVTSGVMFERFGCNIPNAGPDTPDKVVPDIVVERDFFEDDIVEAPDGSKISVFGFADPDGEHIFPGPTMRFKEGQVVHSVINSKKNTHTIHHHGIEATAFNDGVGHTSFEVNGNYAYQFLASTSGTYFYHCHKNTTLHFELGMYGMLIVDPDIPGAPFIDGGPGAVYRKDDIVPYDVEAIWAVDEFDTSWREIHHSAGLRCPFYHVDEDGKPTGNDNPRMNDFNPDIFLISGVTSDGSSPIVDPRVAVEASVGQTILIRLLNAGYTIQEYSFDGISAEVVEIDGRTLGRHGKNSFSRPFTIADGELFKFTSAQRWSMLVKPESAGSYPFRVKFRDWITGEVLGEVETRINVS